MGGLDTSIEAVIGDNLYIKSNRGESSYNLLVFNRVTNALTQLTSEPSTYSFSTGILNNSFYFISQNSATNTSLVRVSGAAVNLVKVINSSPTYPGPIKTIAGRMYFFADNGVNGTEPWVSDGTMAGTNMLVDSNPGSAGSYGNFLNAVGDFSFFSANARLYRTRGTPASTQIQYHIPGLEILGGSTILWENRLHVNSQSYLANEKTLFYIKQNP